MKILPSERAILRGYQEQIFSLIPFSSCEHESPSSASLLREDAFPVFAIETFTNAAPRWWDRMCPTCGVRCRSALLIPRLLGCFLLQNYHTSFLLLYPVREENTPIWPLLASIRYKYKIQHDLIFHLFLTQPANKGSAPGSPHPQCSEKHIWCGYCWGWSPVVEVNEKSDVLSADCMICFQDDLHWSVKRFTEMPEERKDFHRAVLGAPKITNISSFSSDVEHSFSWRQTVILFFCIIYSECT